MLHDKYTYLEYLNLTVCYFIVIGFWYPNETNIWKCRTCKKNINIGRAYRIIKSLNVALKKCFYVVFVINSLGTNVVSIHIWVLFINYLHKY